MKQWIYLLFVSILSISASENMRVCYPLDVVSHGNESRILVFDQQSLQSTRLWLYNPHADTYGSGLLFTYCPTNITMLPSGEGFSFVDRGRIRIKKFNRRSVLSLDIMEPIFNITQLQWINDELCYFSAKQNGRYRLFICNMDGELDIIAEDAEADLIYPSLVGDAMFYLSQDSSQKITLKRISLEDRQSVTVLSLGRSNCAFLKMTSLSHGYICRMPFSTSLEDDLLAVEYCSIDRECGLTKLFTFDVPVDQIFGTGTNRLVESIVPLLPRVSNDEIIYNTWTDGGMELSAYDVGTKRQRLLYIPGFSALKWNGYLYSSNFPNADDEQGLLSKVALK